MPNVTKSANSTKLKISYSTPGLAERCAILRQMTPGELYHSRDLEKLDSHSLSLLVSQGFLAFSQKSDGKHRVYRLTPQGANLALLLRTLHWSIDGIP